MAKKLLIMLLIGAVSLLGTLPVVAKEVYELKEYEAITGEKLTFNEAPEFRIKVAAGELPPLEERLPDEPLIVEPLQEIGKYGGIWHRAHTGTSCNVKLHKLIDENLTRYNRDFTKILPNVVKGWEFSKDFKSITLFLRKGMKWSDGAPFTADDFMFWYEDIILNDELTPAKPSWFKVGRELGKMEKVDEYTIKISFTEPYPVITEVFCAPGRGKLYAPKHYLKKFHPKYTSMDEIKKEMEREGFNLWTDLFEVKREMLTSPDLPTISAWVCENTVDQPIQILARNPYYWKVDTQGNQLPYINEIHRTFVGTPEAIKLKALAGDIDFQVYKIGGTDDYPMYKQNEEKGGYRVVPDVPFIWGVVMGFNFFHKDPFLRKLFRNKQFRIAISLALDREEMKTASRW